MGPQAALAFWRSRRFEIGATYSQVMYPAPLLDDDPRTPSFQERDHWLLSTMSLSNNWLSGGFDFGVVRAIEKTGAKTPQTRATTRASPAGASAAASTCAPAPAAGASPPTSSLPA